jgi:multiple sugar transport system permease protein
MTVSEPVPPVAAAERLAVEPGLEARAPGGIPGRERGERIRTAVAYAVMILVALLFFVPFIWSVSTSFKTLPESVEFSLIPDEPTLAGYREALSTHNFGRYMLNSAGLALVITLSNLFLASLGGYAFARLRFPGREVLFLLVLGTLMVPDQLRLVPVYTMLSDARLVGTYQGFVLIYLVQATSLFLMRQYFLTIPRDLEEAAKLDAAGYFKTYWKVMLPLAGPALAAVTIIVFQGAWNEFFWALVILQDEDKYTIPVGIAAFSSEYRTQWPPLMAASVIAILPIALLYVFFQRYFIAGVAASGVKG